MRNELGSELNSAAAKLSPVVVMGTAEVVGWGVQEWMYAATIAYVVLQAAYLIWKWRDEARKRREA